MSLLVFLLACGVGALLGLVARPAGWFGKLAGGGGLLVAFVAALLIKSSTSLTVGDVVLVGSTYSGLFLACAAASGLLLAPWDWWDSGRAAVFPTGQEPQR